MSGTSNGAALTYQLLINTGADRPFHRCEYIDTNMSLTIEMGESESLGSLLSLNLLP